MSTTSGSFLSRWSRVWDEFTVWPTSPIRPMRRGYCFLVFLWWHNVIWAQSEMGEVWLASCKQHVLCCPGGWSQGGNWRTVGQHHSRLGCLWCRHRAPGCKFRVEAYSWWTHPIHPHPTRTTCIAQPVHSLGGQGGEGQHLAPLGAITHSIEVSAGRVQLGQDHMVDVGRVVAAWRSRADHSQIRPKLAPLYISTSRGLERRGYERLLGTGKERRRRWSTGC